MIRISSRGLLPNRKYDLGEQIEYIDERVINKVISVNYVLQVDERSGKDNCDGCIFGYSDGELAENSCPFEIGCPLHDEGQILSKIKSDIGDRNISCSRVRQVLCNLDICQYYKEDLSCQLTSPSCLFKEMIDE